MQLFKLKQKLEEEKAEANANDEVMLLAKASQKKEESMRVIRYLTGIYPIDNNTKIKKEDKGGFSGGDLIIVSAPTGNGKTLFCATLSFSLMKTEGLPSLWFTYEVNIYNLWHIFKNMGASEEDLFCVPFEHTTGKLEWLEKKIKEAKDKFFVKTVVIDHLGFLTPFQKMNQNMSQNYSTYLAQIVRELKTIAVREDIIIFLPVHMNKSAGDDPTLRDIGNSGGIAQESDFVFLLARQESPKIKTGVLMENYYTPYTKIIMAKNRLTGSTPSWWMTKKDGKLIQDYPQTNEEKSFK